MANKKVSQLTSKPSVLTTDLFPIADPSTGQLFKTTISDLGTAIGSGVSSVNTLVGAVVLDTDDIQELASPTNRWFTDTRARAAISGGTGISYNSGTGVITNAVTSGQIATALGYTPANGANYLALAGGTMGGAIFGTTATFESSSSVIALGITLSGASGDGVKITHSAGRAFNIQSSGSGFGILINNETASTSFPFTIQKQGLGVVTLTDSGDGVFAGSLTANSFIKTGGTSSQFLKADGSIDSSTYLTTGTAASTYVALTGNQSISGVKTFTTQLAGAQLRFSESGGFGNVSGYTQIGGTSDYFNFVNGGNTKQATFNYGTGGSGYTYTLPNSNGTLALTSQLSSYLPLSGGTLTGALSGTSATFSGSIGTAALNMNNMSALGSISGGAIFLPYTAPIAFRSADGSVGYGNIKANTSGAILLNSGGEGNVGIGTTAPQDLLDVNGSLRLRGATPNWTAVTDNAVFDYVNTSIFSTSPVLRIASIGTSSVGANMSFHTGTSTALTERMRITSGGNVLIGQTVASGSTNGIYLRTGIESGFIVTNDNALQLSRYSSNGDIETFFRDGTKVGSISVTTSLTSYNVTSDYRLKQDFKSVDGLDLVNKIKVYNYEWKSDNTRMDGVLAHELGEVLPYAVTGVKDGEQMQSVDYSKIVPVLIQAIKDQQVQIEQLKNK